MPLGSESESSVSILFPRVDLYEFHDYNELVHSVKKISFQIKQAAYVIQSPIVKTAQSVLYSGRRNGRNVFIKVFAEEGDYLKELSVLQDSGSDELLEFVSGKFPMLMLKFTEGRVLSDILRDRILSEHLELNPQDRAIVDKLWSNYREISNEAFQDICAVYLDNTYLVRLGDKTMIHPGLNPEKVLITPDLQVKVIDYAKLRDIPISELELKFLRLTAQENVIDSFNRFKARLEEETRAFIRLSQIPEDETAAFNIPEEILFNPNYDSAMSQLEGISQIEEIPSYDHSITTIKEEKLFDSYDIEFPPLRTERHDRRHKIRQDLPIYRKGKWVKNLRGSISDLKIYDADFSQGLSGEDLPWDSSGHTDVTVHAGSKRSGRNVMSAGDERFPPAQNSLRSQPTDSVLQKSKEQFGFWNRILGAQQRLISDWPHNNEVESTDNDGQLILDGDDYFLGPIDSTIASLPFAPHGPHDYNPSNSVLSDTYYSTASDLFNAPYSHVELTTHFANGHTAEGSSHLGRAKQLRKHRSVDSLSTVENKSNYVRRARSFVSHVGPSSLILPPKDALKLDLLRKLH